MMSLLKREKAESFWRDVENEFVTSLRLNSLITGKRLVYLPPNRKVLNLLLEHNDRFAIDYNSIDSVSDKLVEAAKEAIGLGLYISCRSAVVPDKDVFNYTKEDVDEIYEIFKEEDAYQLGTYLFEDLTNSYQKQNLRKAIRRVKDYIVHRSMYRIEKKGYMERFLVVCFRAGITIGIEHCQEEAFTSRRGLFGTITNVIQLKIKSTKYNYA